MRASAPWVPDTAALEFKAFLGKILPDNALTQ